MTDKPKLPEKITSESLDSLVGDKCVATISTGFTSVRVPTESSFYKITKHLSDKINAIISYLESKEHGDKPLQEWEYEVSNMYTGDTESFIEVQKKLNRLGSEGWELCSTSGNKDYSVLIFKRSKV